MRAVQRAKSLWIRPFGGEAGWALDPPIRSLFGREHAKPLPVIGVQKRVGVQFLVVRITYQEFTMSDDSFADFREADGRFAKGNRGTPDLVPASAAVTNAVLNGDVTPDEGRVAARVLDRHAA